jgi:hypothetical protein
LTVPILDLIDVIFQLQDGGWIRYSIYSNVEIWWMSYLFIETIFHHHSDIPP